MKEALKVLTITFVGLIIAVVVYPFLHESGHSLAAMIVGAKIVEFNLYPLPNVLCNVQSIGIIGMVVIGISGILFPFLLTTVIQPRRFRSWYICFTIRVICLLSFIIAFFAAMVFRTDLKMVNEDITQVIQLTPDYRELYAVTLLGLMIWDVFLVVKSHPITQCLHFFDLENQKANEA